MPPKSKKRVADAYDSDDGFVADAPQSKKARSQRKKAAHGGMRLDDEGNQFWEISDKRRLTVSEFRGKAMISIREYYEKDGKQLPGKKGISMTMEQFSAVVSLLPQLEHAVAEKGEHISRPDYAGKTPAAVDDAEDGEAAEARKPNFEATSDEDE